MNRILAAIVAFVVWSAAMGDWVGDQRMDDE